MVDISINDKNELIVSFRGGNFHELVEAAKYANLTFDRTNKVWKGSIPRLHDVVAEFNTVEPVELSALTQKKAADYMNSLREQKVERRVFDWSPLKFSPLVGKGEYKDFQKLDIQTAYNHDRYFFAWGTGCGKSYALAALYANYRQKYGIRKAILFSSSIGILNVKQELEKFIDIDPNTIKVIGSVAKLKGEDRLVVAPEIDILIMTYDALKYVQDAYHDYAKKDNTKKRNGAKSSKFKINQLPLEDWLNGHEGILFMDESHLLGNPKSRRSECVDMVLPYFQKRYLFTATPWDDFSKAYMQLRALDNQLVEGLKYQDWLAEYYDIGTRWSAYAPDLNSLDEKKERSLNENLRRDYMIVRKKEDVLDIPAQYEYP
jgi:superfamily II DNA or RNA helicase